MKLIMKGDIGKLNNITPENYFKLFRIEEALFPILKNIGLEQIKSIAKQELFERITKRETINKEFQNMKFQTRGDRELLLHSRDFVPWVSLRKGNIEIINRIDRTYHAVTIETLTPSDILEINSPTGIKLGNNKLEVIPINMLGKNVWQISIISGDNNGLNFYVCLSNNKIEIIANEDGYLSGDYSDMIDGYKPSKDFYVKLVPFEGKTTSVKKGGTDVFTPNITRIVNINEFLSVA